MNIFDAFVSVCEIGLKVWICRPNPKEISCYTRFKFPAKIGKIFALKISNTYEIRHLWTIEQNSTDLYHCA